MSKAVRTKSLFLLTHNKPAEAYGHTYKYREVWAPGQHLLGSKAHHKYHVFHIYYRSREAQSGSRCSLSLSLSRTTQEEADEEIFPPRTRKFHLLCKVSMTNASVSGLLPLLFYSLHTGRCNLWISSKRLGCENKYSVG